jgi:hypothetical protein
MTIFNSQPAADVTAPAPDTANPAAATDAQPEPEPTEPTAAAPDTDTPAAADAATEPTEPAPVKDDPDAKVDWKKRYSDLRREMAKQQQARQPQPPQPKAEPKPADTVDPEFVEQWNRDPKGTIEKMAADMAMRQSRQLVEPLLRAKAEENYASNMQALAADYPEANTEAGYKQFAEALQTLAQEWGAEHLVYNPPLELMEAAAKRVFGKSRAVQAALEAGKKQTMDQIKAKQGLAVNAAKPKITPKTPEDEAAEMILNAGRRKSIFG